MWAERFDRDLDDVFAVQDEIAAAIAERLKVSLSEGDESGGSGDLAPAPAPSLDPEVHEMFLRARFFQEQRLLAQAREYFGKVIEREPSFVPAHVGIAQSWAFEGLMMMKPPREAMVLAKEAATRTLALDPASAGGQSVLGMVKWLFDWDAAGAESSFVEALARDESQAVSRCYFGFYLAATPGRFEEALLHVNRAVELDPLGDAARVYQGMVHYLSGDYARAVALLSDYTKVQENSYLGQRLLGLALSEIGDLDGAVVALDRCLGLSQRHRWGVVDLALIRLSQGRDAEAQRLYEEAAGWSARGGHSCQLAIVPYRMGDLDGALDIVEKAIADRDGVLALVNHWPQFEGLRDEPRFKELYEAVGF